MAEGSGEMVGTITINNTGKKFITNDGTEVRALNGINLTINAGTFVSLIGPSGCGKTTLLRLMAGLTEPTEGKLYLDDAMITEANYEKGFMFQNHGLFPWLTIYDNVAFGLKARGIYKKSKKEVLNYLKMVGLEGFQKSYPHQLSGGMCQRAALARALVVHPKVLLLDEPLASLDAFTRMNMQDEILRIWKEKQMTMVMVTHDVDEAIYLSDQIIIMSPRPSKIEEILHVELSRPRARNHPEFMKYRSHVLEVLEYTGHTVEPDYYL